MSLDFSSLMLETLLKGTVILLCAYCISGLLRRLSSAERHFIWLLAFVCLLLLPLLALVLPKISMPMRYIDSVELLASKTAVDLKGDVNTEPRMVEKRSSISDKIHLLPSKRVAGKRVDFVSLAMMVYFGLAMCVLAWQLWRVFLVRRSISLLQVLEHSECRALLSLLSSELGVKRRVRLMVHASDVTPWTWGVLKPMVVVPKSFVQWPRQEKINALLHELAHIKRFDIVTTVFVRILCALYWANPMVWVFSAKMINEAEKACDDAVLLSGSHGLQYADQLLGLANHIVRDRARLNVVAAMAACSPLSYRIKSILNVNARRNAMSRLKRLILSVLASLFLLPLAALNAASELSANRLSVDGNGEYLPLVKLAALYPRQAVEQAIEGYVVLEFDVTELGFVDNIKVLESEPKGVFDRSAIDAAGQLIYLPRMENNTPVRTVGVQNQIRYQMGSSPAVEFDEQKFYRLDKNGPQNDAEVKELADMYRAKKMYAKATEMIGGRISDELKLDPQKFELLRSSMLAEKQALEWQIKSVIRALEVRAWKEKSSDLYVELAKLYADLNDMPKAKGYIMQAFRLNNLSDLHKAREVLAAVLVKAGNYTQAMSVYRTLLNRSGQNSQERQEIQNSIKSLEKRMNENQALEMIANKAIED